MLRSVRFVLTQYGYFGKEESDDKTQILSTFLSSEVGSSCIEFFLDCARNPNFHSGHGNATFFQKKNDIFSVGDLYSRELEATEDLDGEELETDGYLYGGEHQTTFDLPVDQFIKLIETWDVLTKQKVKEIFITWDGENISVEGRD